MNNNLVDKFANIKEETTYLTSLYGYRNNENGHIVYDGRYLLKSYFEQVQTSFPDAASVIAQIFTIPIRKNKDLVDVYEVDPVLREKHLQSIQNQLYNALDNVDYEQEIYGAVEDLKRVVEECCFDREMLISFQEEIDEFKKSLRTFLHADLSEKIQLYEEQWGDNIEEHPITKQMIFINKCIDRFVDNPKRPHTLHTIISRRNDGYFNDIEDYALHFLYHKYGNANAKSNEKEKELSQEELYNQAIDELRIAVFQLNNIFFTPEERSNGSKIHEIQEPVLKLFDRVLKYIWSIQKRLETPEQWDGVTRKLNLFIAQFLNSAYQHLPDDDKSAEIGVVFQNLWSSIYDAVDKVLHYKKYETFSAEYNFIKDILTALQWEYNNYFSWDPVPQSVQGYFQELSKLRSNFIQSLSEEEKELLIQLALAFEQFAFLEKMQDNKMIPSTKK